VSTPRASHSSTPFIRNAHLGVPGGGLGTAGEGLGTTGMGLGTTGAGLGTTGGGLGDTPGPVACVEQERMTAVMRAVEHMFCDESDWCLEVIQI
jgi:hypothetical protein